MVLSGPFPWLSIIISLCYWQKMFFWEISIMEQVNLVGNGGWGPKTISWSVFACSITWEPFHCSWWFPLVNRKFKLWLYKYKIAFNCNLEYVSYFWTASISQNDQMMIMIKITALYLDPSDWCWSGDKSPFAVEPNPERSACFAVAKSSSVKPITCIHASLNQPTQEKRTHPPSH